MLIQNIYVERSLKEAGLNIKDWEFSHKEPFIKIKSITKPLIFPLNMIREWGDKKGTVFRGKITSKRRDFLVNFPDAKITNDLGGRNKGDELWKDIYWDEMINAEFVLCPDGDFVWTYRFFEAIMCGSIPIIQNTCDLYKGFCYLTKDDKKTYNAKDAKYNLELLKDKFTLNEKDILSLSA